MYVCPKCDRMKMDSETNCINCAKTKATRYIPEDLQKGIAKVKAIDSADRFLNE